MRKTVLIILMAVFILAGCAKEVSKKEIGRRTVPAHTETYYTTHFILAGKVLVPVMTPHTRFIQEHEEILYEITYDSGKKQQRWEVQE